LAESRAIAAALVARVEHELVSHDDGLRQLAETVAASATELAFEIAEAVLGRELSLRTDPGADAITRAARLLPDTGARISRVVVRLHPDDLARLSEPVESLVPGRELVLQADPSVAPSGCVLDAGASRVDASIATAMARVREVLLP
jgi:flagellar assembly protein FliH